MAEEATSRPGLGFFFTSEFSQLKYSFSKNVAKNKISPCIIEASTETGPFSLVHLYLFYYYTVRFSVFSVIFTWFGKIASSFDSPHRIWKYYTNHWGMNLVIFSEHRRKPRTGWPLFPFKSKCFTKYLPWICFKKWVRHTHKKDEIIWKLSYRRENIVIKKIIITSGKWTQDILIRTRTV